MCGLIPIITGKLLVEALCQAGGLGIKLAGLASLMVSPILTTSITVFLVVQLVITAYIYPGS